LTTTLAPRLPRSSAIAFPHSLKTNSAQFGATALFELCRDIEVKAKEGNMAATQVAEARAEFEKVRQALGNLREV